ncbi:tRNA modification GTPase MnmE [termite gut metagenome]|uniref:tRNA modification GTPase MnmE n=1 Tax=termite gut metagenome TaxID=433724 RepID=A0A5J4PLS7_9ZZZZ
MNQDTICAMATAQGGAIGLIRISGSNAIGIADNLFAPAGNDKNFKSQKPYTLTFGRIFSGEEMIDEVLVSLFRSPHSYTGEDSVEITCHGSPYIMQQIMQLLIARRCIEADEDAIRSATASAWLKSIFPFKKAR